MLWPDITDAGLAAEWVETAAHRETARRLGCAYGQGRYFMREVRA